MSRDSLSIFLRAVFSSNSSFKDVRVWWVIKKSENSKQIITIKYFTSFVYNLFARFTSKKKLILFDKIEQSSDSPAKPRLSDSLITFLECLK